MHLVIAPFRAAASTRAYRRIWTPGGSPLLVQGRASAAAVQTRLPGDRVLEAETGLHDGAARARLVDELWATSTGHSGGARMRREDAYEDRVK